MPKAKKKKRVGSFKPVDQPPSESRIEESEDGGGQLSEGEDGEFFHESLSEGRLGFLTKMGRLEGYSKKLVMSRSNRLEQGVSNRKRKRQKDDDLKESEFESTPRAPTWLENKEASEENMHYLLPLKSKHSLIQQPAVHRPAGDSSDHTHFEDREWDSGTPQDKGGNGETGSAVPAVMSAAALLAVREEKLKAKKEAIADVASRLIESPEENIVVLKQLRSLCSERDPDVAITVRKLAMVSFATVCKDIAPSYRIRELSEKEKAVKVSKDVRKLRHFEQTLLHDYQLFLSLCDDTVKLGLGEGSAGGSGGGGGGGGPAPAKRRRERRRPLALLDDGESLSESAKMALAEVALSCLCELAVSLAHFNFCSTILSFLVPRMSSKGLGGKVGDMCCEAVEKLFASDKVGDASLEAMQLIAKMVKASGYKCKPAVLRTFLQLQLHHVETPVGAAGTSSQPGRGREERRKESRARLAKMTKRQRKRLQAEARLDREMREAEAIESRDKKSKLQTEIVKLVFLTYFRILKNSRHSPLLAPVLEGLAKFAHLINVDFFSDLMSVLHSLAETGGLSNRECMQCVFTAFEILSGQGAALNIDPRQFYTQLYQALLQLDTCSSDSDVLLALDCLDRMMRKRRQVSTQRVLGFVKRLSTISLQLLPGACLAVMATIKQFMTSYSQCGQLLDVEEAAVGGLFRPDVPDPEMCHASSSVLWDLSLCMSHYDPTVRQFARHLLAGAPSQGRGALHAALAHRTTRQHLQSGSGDVMTGAPPPPPHPAVKLAQKGGRQKSGLYYYSDGGGIRSEEIRNEESEAIRTAEAFVQQL